MKAKEEIKKNDDKKFNKAVQEAMLEEAHKKKILNSYEKTANQLGEMQAARTQIKELEKEQKRFKQRMDDADVREAKILDSYNRLEPER